MLDTKPKKRKRRKKRKKDEQQEQPGAAERDAADEVQAGEVANAVSGAPPPRGKAARGEARTEREGRKERKE